MQSKRITTNIKEIIANKIERSKATYIESGKKCFYLYNGCSFTELQFNLILPIEPKKFITHY